MNYVNCFGKHCGQTNINLMVIAYKLTAVFTDHIGNLVTCNNCLHRKVTLTKLLLPKKAVGSRQVVKIASALDGC